MLPPLDRLEAALRDRYQVLGELGAGGMATVYRARDLRHDREVALKVLRPELAAVVGAERFLAEIKTTAHLQHPNILPLFDSGEAGGLLFYVMPLVPGESLRDRLNREKELPVDEAVRLTVEVAGALDYAHRHGVIHRDIKPENVLLQDGRALLADFGIALAVRHAGGERVTETGLSLGTPQYMSPEQATGDRTLDGRSDLYSLACVLYEMLGGIPPHSGPSVQAIIASLVAAEPRPLAELRPGLPEPILEAVHRALRKLPADRFATVAQFAEALVNPRVTGSRRWARRRGVRIVPWLVAAASMVFAAMGWMHRTAGTIDHGPRITSINPPDGLEFDAQASFALSPDGSRIVFRAITESGDAQLWMRSFDTTEARPLSGTEGADWPFWSPNGRSVAFFASEELRRLDLDDGQMRRLCPAPKAQGGAWSGTGLIAYAAAGRLWTVAADGGQCDSLARRERGTPRRPSWLPDGRHLIYSLWFPDSVKIVEVTTDSTRVLLAGGSDAAFVGPDLLVVANHYGNPLQLVRLDLERLQTAGELVSVGVRERSQKGIASYTVAPGVLAYLETRADLPPWETDRTGRITVPTLDEPGDVWNFRTSRDGRGLYYMSDAQGLWRLDLGTRIPTRLGSGTGSFPVEGPAGQLIYTRYNLNPNTATAGCDIVRFDPTRRVDSVLVPGRCWASTDWSPDGRDLLMERGSAPWLEDTISSSSIWRLTVATGAVAPLVTGQGAARDGTFSPDGRWIAYASDETGRYEIYLRRLDGAALTVRISKVGGRWPRWHRDGRALYFLSPDGVVMSAALTSSTAPAGEPIVLFRHPRWIRSLFSEVGSVFHVSPDGSRFFFRRPTNPPYLTLVRDWTKPLSR